MPPVLLAAIAGTSILGALASTLFSVATSLLLGMIGSALFGKPRGPKAPAQSITSIVRSAEEPRRRIYGQRMTSGVLAFAATGRFDKDTIRDLHMVIALCDGPITEIGDIYFNDIISTDGRFYGSNSHNVNKHLGSSTQDADAQLVAAMPSQWTVNHRLRGVAYVYTRFIWISTPLIWNAGIPNVKALLRGVSLFDPRLGGSRYSRNPALALRDYLLLPEAIGGFGAAADEVDDAYAIAAANACDEVVPTISIEQPCAADVATNRISLLDNHYGFTLGDRVRLRTDGGSLPGGISPGVDYWWTTTTGQDPTKSVSGCLSASYAEALNEAYIGLTTPATGPMLIWRTGQVRYCCDAVVTLDRQPNDIIEDLLGSMAGGLAYTQGKWRMFAGVGRVVEPGEIDVGMLRGPLTIQTRTPRREIFNSVRGTIPDLSRYGQETSFPVVTNPYYQADDGGVQIFQEISLPCVTSPLRAQRIAKVHLERSRQGITVTAPLNWSGLPFAIGDVRRVSDDALGWSSKLFEIVNWTLAEGGGVDVVLQEYAAAVYDWNDGQATHIDPAPDTDLPDWSDVQAPGLVLSDDYVISAGQPITRLLLAVTMPDDEMVIRYRVQYRLAGAARWSPAADDATEILGVTDGATYEVQVQSINTLGAPSPWTLARRQIVGQLAPPADVVNFAVNIIGSQAHLSWDPVPDLDLSHYRIRFASDPAQTVWGNAVDLVAKVARPATSIAVPGMVGAFMIKAVDYKGHESINPAISASTVASVVGVNVITVRQEAPAWSGTHDGTVGVDGALQLLSGGLWDDAPGLWDDLPTTWDLTGGNAIDSGTYTFGPIDLGAVYTSRVTVALDVGQASFSDVWDDLAGLWDDLARLWDGGATGDTNVALQVAMTTDDPASGGASWSAWRAFVVGDYTCRGYRFRALLSTAQNTLTPIVTALSVTVDMPDRTDPIPDQASLAGGSTVLYAVPFAAPPAIGIVGKNLQTGDYWVISAETEAGFAIRFFNAAGAGVVRNFSGLAKGFGRKAA